MDKISVGYVCSVTERESGWGSRHDGYILGYDKNVMEKYLNDKGLLLYGDSREYSAVDSVNVRMVALTEAGEKLMDDLKVCYDAGESERPFVWVSSLDEYIVR